eukprot:647897_1
MCFTTFSFFLLCIKATACTRYYVDSSAPSSGSGLSWDDPLNSLNSALALATSEVDKIWLKGGATYIPTNPTDRSDCFVTSNGLSIYGGFDGTETTLNQRNANNEPSIISGDIGAVDDISDNCYHVIQYTRALTLHNVIIQHGNANYDGAYTPSNTNNALHRYAGALITTDVLRPTNLHLNDVIFRNNTAINGGALWFAASPLTSVNVVITNSEFEHNKATDDKYEGGYGGAIYEMLLANITLINTKFTANEAMNRGGAIYQDYGAYLYAIDCVFQYNKVNGLGGAIFSEDRNSQTDGTFPHFVSCVFRFNSAVDGGAIFWYNGVIGTLLDNTFRYNAAQRNGAAIALINSESVSNGSVLVSNDAYNETLLPYDDINTTLSFNITAELHALYSTMQTETDVYPFTATDALCFVNGFNTNSIKNGSSWSHAFNDIQECLDGLRTTGGDIWVRAGTYVPNTTPEWKRNLGETSNIHKSFSMYDNIRMYGGFTGTETNRTERNWRDNPTHLSCQLSSRLQCNQLINAADDTVIDGFIFENAGRGIISRRRLANSISVEEVLNSSPLRSGSGIVSNSTSLVVVNSIFHKLFSAGKGGAVYCIGMQGSSGINKAPTFMNVAFLGNRAAVRGGAISADAQCNFECKSCIFKRNSCSAKGGAIYLDFDCDPIITDSTFTSNYAMESGGCIAADGQSFTTFNGTNRFTSNAAQMEGGCLYSGSGVSIGTQQGFKFNHQAPIFTDNTIINRVGHGDIYGWPYSIIDTTIITPTDTTSNTSPQPPNIILFFVDDLELTSSWDMFAPKDGTVYVDRTTPNINAFMNEAVLFPKSYAAAPLCSPSRFALITGRQPSRGEYAIYKTLATSSGYLGTNVTIITSKLDFNDSILNLPYVLQHDARTPYYTGMVGKWHLRGSDSRLGCSDLNEIADADLYEQCTDLVKQQGFDFVDAFYDANIDSDNEYFSHNPEWMVSQSQTFVDHAVNVEQKPFFLYFASTLTHTPAIKDALLNFSFVDSPKGRLNGDDIPSDTAMNIRSDIWHQADASSRTDPKKERDAALYWIDDCFAALITYLKDNDLYDKTMIVFMNDHGMQTKAMLYEGGSRIVNMVRYPPLFGTNGPHILPDDFIVSNVDIAATIFELTGVDPPNEYKLDGISWLDDVANHIRDVDSAPTCCEYRYIDLYNSHAIVSSQYQYIFRANKLVDDTKKESGLAIYPHMFADEQLYHLTSDPSQKMNQIYNVSLAPIVIRFQTLMRQYIEDICVVDECKMPNILSLAQDTTIEPTQSPSKSPTQNSNVSLFSHISVLHVVFIASGVIIIVCAVIIICAVRHHQAKKEETFERPRIQMQMYDHSSMSVPEHMPLKLQSVATVSNTNTAESDHAGVGWEYRQSESMSTLPPPIKLLGHTVVPLTSFSVNDN